MWHRTHSVSHTSTHMVSSALQHTELLVFIKSNKNIMSAAEWKYDNRKLYFNAYIALMCVKCVKRNSHTYIVQGGRGSYTSSLMFCLGFPLSINVPYLMKEFIKVYYTSSAARYEGDINSEVFMRRQLWSCPGRNRMADRKGRNRWCDSAFLSYTESPTDICASSSCVFCLPPGQKMPCGHWRRDSVAPRIIERWCWH